MSIGRALSMLVLWVVHSVSVAAIVWSENFEGATSGQAVHASPIDWSRQYGSIFVETGPHPGWTGNAIIGDLTTAAPEGLTGSAARAVLPLVPNVQQVSLSFDAWAPTGPTTASNGTQVGVVFDNGGTIYMSAWTNCCLDNVWQVFLSPEITGESDLLLWNSDSDFFRDRTVNVRLTLDYDLHQAWVSFDDGSSSFTTPVFPFLGMPRMTEVEVYIDRRPGAVVGDFDNFSVNAVPEPATYALALAGIALVAFAARGRGFSGR